MVATVPSLVDTGHLFPRRVLMETSTERPAQAPLLLLGDIVLTLRFGNSLGMCWRLWFLSNGSKGKVPKAKSLPAKSLECYDAMQISSNLRRGKKKNVGFRKQEETSYNMWVPMNSVIFPPSCMYGEGNGTPLQYFCLENPMDGGAWWAAVHGVEQNQTQLSDFTFTFHFHALEKEMATHSSVLAWRIPGMREPGGLPSMGPHRVGHNWSDLAAAAAAAAADTFWLSQLRDE